MHESRLVANLLDEASRRAGSDRIASITLRVGAMAAVSEAGLRDGVADSAQARFGYQPAVTVTVSDDPLEASAMAVVLESITVGGL